MQGMRVAAEPPFRTSLCYRVRHDTGCKEAAEEIVDISGGSIEQKAFSRHFYVGGLKKLNTVSRMFDVNFFQTLFIFCQVAPSPVDMPT